MPIEAVKIPQNVYVEDRIIGPITLRQLIITGLGLGVSYALFGTLSRSGVTNVVILWSCWIPAVIMAAFAFLKINDLTLFNIILLSIENANKPNIRYWSPHPGLSINLITKQHMKAIDDMKAKERTNSEKLADITRQLEKRQEEFNRLSQHAAPAPGALEGVKTKLEQHAAHGLYEHDDASEEAETAEATAPVQKSRVQASGLDKQRSIDSITSAMRAYESLNADQAPAS